jgi:glutaredoxin-like protein
MALLGEKEREKVAEALKGLERDVRLVVFTQEFECPLCAMNRELAQELGTLSPKLRVEVRDFVKDKVLADEIGVDKIPAISVQGDRELGVHFYGIPAGYEFATLIEDVRRVSRRESALPDPVAAELAKLQAPVRIEVIVSPTCPFCPAAVLSAHRLAMASELVTADMVEGSEFPHIVQRYGVQGVPHTVVNGLPGVTGALPEHELARKVAEIAGTGHVARA